MLVYVLSQDNKPLMPTRDCGKVRWLLKHKRAKVIHRCPFTIKLLYKSTEFVNNLILGIDTGSSHIGSAVSDLDTNNVVYISDVKIRNDITERMERRSKFRRSRRTRKTRYRPKRFLNRANSRRSDRINPTLTSKINSHLKEIKFVKSILPISNTILETAKFDIHKIKNPNVSGEGYQQGPLYGFENIKAYIIGIETNILVKVVKLRKYH